MPDPAGVKVRLMRFGPFELDVRAGELRKHGIKIKLREQPVRILLMLLEQPGEVVLREEIQRRLWPNNTIVEFDHGINAAIQKLRDALGESADQPRYIETVARRGYRFLGEVEKVGEPQPEPAKQPLPFENGNLNGRTVSHYRILGKLGEGGMGVVYRAEDLKLGRIVAIKCLPCPAGELPQTILRRFETEARAASGLNHPHICTIYGFEELDGQPAIVMELVEGETLAARLQRGALKVDQAVAWALQITDALTEAHSKGVVHRDLKPANIMIGKFGVKVLDFGLAKIERQVADQEHTRTLTAVGTLLCTVQYMSPEQAQGKEADARSDIFSFGVVFYEMLTGKRAFEGSDPASLIAAILERDPPALEPEGLNRVVRACLAKDPTDRFQTARDVKRAIEWSVPEDLAEPPFEGRYLRRLWLAWSAAVFATLGMVTFALLHFREPPSNPAVPMRFQIPQPAIGELNFSLSPDGRKLAYHVGDRLWVHFLESGESRDLTASSGAPFWSPDSRFIGFSLKGKLKKIEATGGPPQTVCDYRTLWGGASWSQDGIIVFSDRQVGFFQVPSSGGVPVQLTVIDPTRHETSHFAPSLLPDGRHFVYTRRSSDERKSAIYLGSIDAKPEEQSSRPLVSNNFGARYAPSADPDTGYLLFTREATLMAQPFDNRRLELKGQAAAVAEQVLNFSVSRNDLLVFQRNAASGRQLSWIDRTGRVLGTLGEPGDYQTTALSPDGTRLAVSKRSGQAVNIWLFDLSQSDTSTRFTFGSATDSHPVWSPDGSRIIFRSNQDGTFDLYEKPANGVKAEKILLKSSEDKYPTSWSHDGRFLLYTVSSANNRLSIWVLPLEGDRKPVPFLGAEASEFDAHNARFSPDGRWVAYNSNESGHDAVYVRSFSMNATGTGVEAGGKWQVSEAFWEQPRWREDGRELYYHYSAAPDRMMAVEISAGPAFHAGKPQPLGTLQFAPVAGAWDTADGKRFLGPVNQSGPEPFTVVVNWQSGLKK